MEFYSFDYCLDLVWFAGSITSNAPASLCNAVVAIFMVLPNITVGFNRSERRIHSS